MKKSLLLISLAMVAALALCLAGCSSKPVYESLDGSILNDKIGNDENGTFIEGTMKSKCDSRDTFYVIYNIYDSNDEIIGEACAFIICDKGGTADFKAYVDNKTTNFLDGPVGMSNFAEFVGTVNAMNSGETRKLDSEKYKPVDVISSSLVRAYSEAKAAEIYDEIDRMK